MDTAMLLRLISIHMRSPTSFAAIIALSSKWSGGATVHREET
jgi:hypothetical protein